MWKKLSFWESKQFSEAIWLVRVLDRTGILNLWDLMLYDLRWSWCNNNRNKVHNKWNVLESSLNHPPPPSVEKLSATKAVPGAEGWGLLPYISINSSWPDRDPLGAYKLLPV